MTNLEIEATWKYHNATKHSWQRIRTGSHFLDWPNKPRPFKVYRDVESIPLPGDPNQTGHVALSVIGSTGISKPDNAPVCLEDLASIFHFSAGITRRRSRPGGEILFRAAACTGALYSIELYLVCGDLQDLDAGIYFFSPADSSLMRLRRGDFRGVLVEATAGEPGIAHAPATIICTGTFWRNAWKYRDRTYRHFGWDGGTILANLLAISAARNLPAHVVNGFIDDKVNRLLALDSDREVALNLVPLGRAESAAEYGGEPAPLDLEILPYSHHEIDYPAMREMHAASSLQSMEEVAAWRGRTPAPPATAEPKELIPLEPLSENERPRDSIERVILRRGSSRRFAQTEITFQQLSTLLHCATQGIEADFLAPPGSQLNQLYVVSHAVTGLEPGAYVLHRKPWSLELLKKGEFRSKTGYLGLEQQLPADCCAAVFFMADLNPILERYGNRGYRATQLESGIIGGRLYLSAYAQRLGATGLTFYDDEVTQFFSPHAEGKSAIFLVALGRTDKHRQIV